MPGRASRTLTVFVLTVAGILGLGVLVGWPVLGYAFPDSATATSDPVTITKYDATFGVDEHGTLTAVETLTTQFPYGRHGIFRFFDTTAPWDSHARLIPKDIVVSMDGHAEPMSLSWQKGRRYRVAKIGDPDTTLAQGQHVFTISYKIEGALAPANAGVGGGQSGSWSSEKGQSAFYWNVVAGGWQMPIGSSTSTVRLPADAGNTECFVGTDNSGTCTVSANGDDIVVTTGGLAPRTPVTIRADVAMSLPDQVRLPWTAPFDGVLGQSVPLMVLLTLLGIAGLVVGRMWEWRARETPPGFPVMYEPPAGLGPVQAYYVANERVPGRALVATLLHQAQSGLTRLTQAGTKDWVVEGLGGDWSKVDPVTQEVGYKLGLTDAGARFHADGSVTAGKTLNELNSSLRTTTRAWASKAGLVVGKGVEALGRLLVIAAAAAAVGLAFWHPGGMTWWAVPFAGFAIGGVGLVLPGVGTRRTAAGRDTWSRSGGFYRLLSTPSAQDRFDFSAHKDLYTAYIPYAVAFDCAEEWARKYRLATGEEPPIPVWYVGAPGHAFFGGGDVFSGFESSLRSSIGAYEATQRSSHSGGGGGFGGGGGGGGGGGSW